MYVYWEIKSNAVKLNEYLMPLIQNCLSVNV